VCSWYQASLSRIGTHGSNILPTSYVLINGSCVATCTPHELFILCTIRNGRGTFASAGKAPAIRFSMQSHTVADPFRTLAKQKVLIRRTPQPFHTFTFTTHRVSSHSSHAFAKSFLPSHPAQPYRPVRATTKAPQYNSLEPQYSPAHSATQSTPRPSGP
jgi:hypothetical protein